jgi:Fe-S-cluster containining protein
MKQDQEECLRCGTCCTSGGPALHSEDLHLVLDGKLPLAQLITIRSGELAHNPLTNSLQSVKRELVKISGVGRKWNCCFFDPEEKGCTIYDKRPKACKALKCWDTKDVEELIEKDTLNRLDIIREDSPVRPFVIEHDKTFPCPDMVGLMEGSNGARTESLEDSINTEITYRTKVVSTFDFSLGEELFYFGRPLFHLFVSIGADITEVEGRLLLSWPDRKINL